jgi:hypothetical protein
MKMKFTKKLAQDIAQYYINYILDCMLKYDDGGYSVTTDVDDFEQDFEEALEELGITPTPKRVEEIKVRYRKLQDKALKKIESLYKEIQLWK